MSDTTTPPAGGRTWKEIDDTGYYRYFYRKHWQTVIIWENSEGDAYEWHFTEKPTAIVHDAAPDDARFFGPLRNGWIPVEWGTPEDGEQVLVFSELEGQGSGYKDGDEWHIDYHGPAVEITHWQPLPGGPHD